ncbi:MAG: tyrosine-type recombinase/integrase [Azospirillum sp.]|nr:tyrosine-type recombinase/integrase [Azospirillum sp.]
MARPASPPKLVWCEPRRRWYVRWTDGGRTRERSTGCLGLADAEDWLGRFDARTGGFRPQTPEPTPEPARPVWDSRRRYTPEDLLITEALERYAAARGRRIRAKATACHAVERLVEFWQGLTIADITEETVADYRDRRETGADARTPVSPATVDRELAVLKAAVRAVHKAGKLTRLPGFPRQPKRDGRDFALSEDQRDRLLAAAETAAPHIRLFTWLAAFTAGRHSAILELTWDRVMLDRRQPMIVLNPVGRGQTAKGRATVPIPERLLPILKAARAAAETVGTLHLPVVNFRGKPVKSVRAGFRTLAERAGFQVAGPEKLTPHVLRHTAATIMAAHGVPLGEIAAWLGHSSERTTEKYRHWQPDHLQRGSAALDGREFRPHLAVAAGLRLIGGG